MIDVEVKYPGIWDVRVHPKFGVVRTHVRHPRMLTPDFRGKLDHSIITWWSAGLPGGERYEEETLEWLKSCCSNPWRMDLLEYRAASAFDRSAPALAWSFRFQSAQDLMLFKLART